MEPITLCQLRESLPASLKSSATPELAHRLNSICTDPVVAENIKNNFISYSAVLKEGRFKTEDYLNAVSYVSYKLMGYNNREAYFRVFPDRCKALQSIKKDISPYVAAYHKNKLVNLIMEQSLVPTWVLNQDAYQQAINTQVELMQNSKSDRVRAMAADSILNHLKKPESTAPLINIDMREGSGLDELKNAVLSLAQTQQKMIKEGTPTKVIAEHKIFVEEPTE